MLACRITDSDTLTLLAQGARSDVTFDTGENSDDTHIANGVGWYFNEAWGSWGFVRAGDSVDKDECDVDTSGANDERLCWHININEGGYRCGVIEEQNESTAFERIVYMAEATPTPVTPSSIPTISEWGLIATAGILGIVGFIAVRRRKTAV
jgi:hypothetical protein